MGRRIKPGRLYLAVTGDDLALPLAVAESVRELARMLGVKEGTVRRQICMAKKKKYKHPRYIVVEVEDEE